MAKILFLSPYEWTDRDYERFGANAMREAGHDCQLAVTKLMKLTTLIPQYREFKKKLYVSKPDIIITNTKLSFRTWYVFLCISQSRFTFGFITNTSQPVSGMALTPKTQSKQSATLNYISQRFFSTRLLDSLVRKLPPRLLRLRPCDFIVIDGCRGEQIGYKVVTPSDPKSTLLIPAHSLDYEQAIFRPQTLSTSLPRNYIVFLDQYLENHPDFKLNGIDNVVHTEYEQQLAAFFGSLKDLTNFEVVIAAHPKRPYAKTFAGCECIFNATTTLIKHCSVVAGHYSTALSMAVIFRKPSIILSSSRLDESLVYTAIRAYADTLRVPIYYIDRPLISVDLRLEERSLQQKEYYDNFIKHPASPDQPWWQTLLDSLNRRVNTDAKSA